MDAPEEFLRWLRERAEQQKQIALMFGNEIHREKNKTYQEVLRRAEVALAPVAATHHATADSECE